MPDLLNAELRKIVEADAARQRIQQEGGDPLSSSPEDCAQDIEQQDIDQEERK